MKKFSAIMLLVTVLVSLLSAPVFANKTPYMAGDFMDIEDHWAYDQMSELIAMGILKGNTITHYDPETGENVQAQVARPDKSITRAEFATLLYQALNLVPSQDQANFKDDVPYWAADAVNTLSKEGIVKGNPDGTFRSGNNISRAEIATMLVRALNDKSTQVGKNFPDVPSWHWAYSNIQKASAIGIINGLPNGKFAPDNSASRAEVAVMLSNFITNDKTMTPDDSTLLSRTDDVLKKMETEINSTDKVDLTPIATYFTGEQESLLTDNESALNDLKNNGTVTYQVTYPGSVVKKSDRWAEVVYESLASFKSNGMSLQQRSKEHYYLMKIGDQWYIYSSYDEMINS